MAQAADRRRLDLVGRTAERAVLDRALARSAGGFGCVLLVGEAGVGKSRLATAFAADHLGELTVLRARAHALGSTSSFGVWAEALDRELRARPPDEVRALCAGLVDDLAGTIRAVARLHDGPPPERPGARVLDAITALLRALAARRPLLVVLDDLHLADPSSLTALHHLAWAEEPLVVVATARPEGLAPGGAALPVVLRLEQEGLAERLAVAALDAAGVRELADRVRGGPVPDALVDWLVERARGNPLDTLDLLDGLKAEGADPARPALRRLPDSLSGRVALRLVGLDPEAAALVELLAVVARRTELRTLVALSGRPPAVLVQALEALVRARLVGEHEDGPELLVEIGHPLVADAVYAGIGVARRRVLHRAAARVLRELGRTGEAAAHFARAAEPGDPEAVLALRTAVRDAERAGAFGEALTLLATLVEVLPAGDLRWAEVVDALAWDAQWVVDHRADAQAAAGVPALRAMDAALAGLDDPARRAPVKLRLASFLGWGEGTLAEAAQTCEEAIALFERADDRHGTLLARHELAWLRGYGANLAGLEAQAGEVADAARSAGDDMVLNRANRTIAFMRLLRGRPADAETAFAATVATTGTDRHRQVLAAGGMAVAAVVTGRTAVAQAAMARMRQTDSIPADYLTIVGWWAGDLTGVRALARDVTGIGPTPASRRLGVGLFYSALAAVEVGAGSEAARYAARLRTLYDGHGWIMHSTIADHVEGLVAAHDDRPAEALGLLRRGIEPQLRGDFVMQAVPLLADLAEVAGRAGFPEPTAAVELTRIAERTGLVVARGLAAFAAGWDALRRPTGSREHAEQAVADLAPWPFLRARALHLLARATADRDDTVAALTAAADLFTGCGATVRRAEVLDELAALGSRGRRAAAAARGPASLTGREREVAELAAGGLSAREIGAELFIGERTVESHLARAYARLGVRSKLELARRADELGLRVRTGVRTATPDGPALAP